MPEQIIQPKIQYQTFTYDKAYEDVDEYLADLKTELDLNQKAQVELQDLDYDIWFQKQNKQPSSVLGGKRPKEGQQQVTKCLYMKNLDKKVERKDFVAMLLPFFEDGAELEKEVEIIVMKKGKMRG